MQWPISCANLEQLKSTWFLWCPGCKPTHPWPIPWVLKLMPLCYDWYFKIWVKIIKKHRHHLFGSWYNSTNIHIDTEQLGIQHQKILWTDKGWICNCIITQTQLLSSNTDPERIRGMILVSYLIYSEPPSIMVINPSSFTRQQLYRAMVLVVVTTEKRTKRDHLLWGNWMDTDYSKYVRN